MDGPLRALCAPCNKYDAAERRRFHILRHPSALKLTNRQSVRLVANCAVTDTIAPDSRRDARQLWLDNSMCDFTMRHRFIVCAVFVSILLTFFAPMRAADPQVSYNPAKDSLVYVGTYTGPNKGKGIYAFKL